MALRDPSRRRPRFLRKVLDAAITALAAFAALSLVAGLVEPTIDAAWLWIQGGALPPVAVKALVAAFAVSVLLTRRLHRVAVACGGLLAAACLADAFVYYHLVSRGVVRTWLPVPLSLLLALLLLAWVMAHRRRAPDPSELSRRDLWRKVAHGSLPLWIACVALLV